MDDLTRYKENRLKKDTEFKKEYEKLKPHYELISAMIDARNENGITQKMLSEKTGIRQSNISRIESGKCSPTLETFQKIMEALGKTVTITTNAKL